MIEVDFTKLSKQRYAMSHDWELHIPTQYLKQVLSNDHPMFKSNSNSVLKSGISMVEEDKVMDLNLYCKSTTLPKSSIRIENVRIYGVTTKVILDDEVEDSISLTFKEDQEYSLYKFFSIWKDLGATHRTHASLLRGMQEAVELRLGGYKNSPGKETEYKLTYILHNPHPIQVFLSEPNDRIDWMTLTVVLKYDNFEVK